jgi:hypothetical protein
VALHNDSKILVRTLYNMEEVEMDHFVVEKWLLVEEQID